MNTIGDGFGALMGASRRAAGFSQRHLADRVGISLAAIRDLEQGRTRRPQRRFVDAMVTALKLTGDAETALRLAAEPGDRPRPVREINSDEPVRVRILGPLAVHRATASVPVGRGSRRAVLGRLALSANTPVSVSDLVDVLWDAHPPPASARAVQTYLSRLRTALQPTGSRRADIISHVPGGYQLNLAHDQLDLAEFRHLVQQARPAEPARGVELLAAALALWCGKPLGDTPELHNHPLITALADERIAATLRYAEFGLSTGQADRCLPGLRELATANPLHEPLHARLIAVLAAVNLQACALSAYTDIRRRLVEDLGIEPGPELVDAHRRVLRQEPVVSAGTSTITVLSKTGEPHPPAQLPADIVRFTGRLAALGRLDDILNAHQHGPAVVIAAVSGSGGVGKTALVVRWAHRVRDRFPDGQLYVNLCGFDDGGQVMAPGEALRGFLDALGVAAERVPDTLHAQSVLYRSVLAGRRMLVVLDNARDAEQVRPLLPGDAGIVTLVTSRNQLSGLVAVDGARPIILDVLPADEARQLLVSRLGAVPMDADRAAVAEIVAACARLPLALTIAAARVQFTGFPLAVVAAELADALRRLDVLDTGDRASQIRSVFSWSFAALTVPAGRLFLLLALHAGPEISTAAAASLAAQPAPETLRLLTELTHASLLTEPSPGRFAFHDLLRAYAQEQARTRLTDHERAEAVSRVLEHYLHTAYAADRLISPYRYPIALPVPAPDVVAENNADPAAALAWFRTEHAVLLAAVRVAADHDQHTTCWQLAWTLAVYLDRRGSWQDWIAVGQTALNAAREHGDQLGQAHARSGLGRAYGWLDRHHDALTEFTRAAALFAGLNDRVDQATVHGHLAWLLDRWGRHQDAYDHMMRALQLYEAAGVQPGIADALARLGYHEAKLGRPEAALDRSRQGLALLQQLGDSRGEAITLAMLGNIHQDLHQLDHAAACYERAAELLHLTGERYYEGRCLAALGDTYHATGRTTDARAAWHQGLDILTALHHPEGDPLRTKLRCSEPPHSPPVRACAVPKPRASP